MDLAEISPSSIEASLKALRNGNPPHAALFALAEGVRSPEEKRVNSRAIFTTHDRVMFTTHRRAYVYQA